MCHFEERLMFRFIRDEGTLEDPFDLPAATILTPGVDAVAIVGPPGEEAILSPVDCSLVKVPSGPLPESVVDRVIQPAERPLGVHVSEVIRPSPNLQV